ncbi:HAD-IA family hydrolase [Streptococcus sp. HF-1907]|uniref:HAD-IA family hydrolase n=1 Tax=Streptococcus sp. HF-1907 TaxID=2785793 RepID=UPI00189D0299|nr:HAD-IA family hydrolase [Streptococcus sp. HF-1907]MBF7093947.1 HAD-IA family hydrolase [Streptococcus sp. HF-1907]
MIQTTFIWDFDGTLVESYEAIRQVLVLLYKTYDLPLDEDFVFDFIIKESVGSLLRRLAAEHDLPFEELLRFFNREQEARDDMINLMPYAKEALQLTKEKGVQHFIYTHKGATTGAVLARLGIDHFFTEVITSANGFARKPHPEGVDYLVTKYGLDKLQTYYIGDRRLDVEVAENAGIQSLNLHQPDSAINRKIDDLSDLVDLLSDGTL